MKQPINPNLLLANAPDMVNKDNDGFDWQRATVSKSLDELRTKLGTPPITLHLDQRIIDYFNKNGNDYQHAINNVLLEYIASH